MRRVGIRSGGSDGEGRGARIAGDRLARRPGYGRAAGGDRRNVAGEVAANSEDGPTRPASGQAVDVVIPSAADVEHAGWCAGGRVDHNQTGIARLTRHDVLVLRCRRRTARISCGERARDRQVLQGLCLRANDVAANDEVATDDNRSSRSKLCRVRRRSRHRQHGRELASLVRARGRSRQRE